MFRNVHALTPDANHDEASRMDFVRAFRAHLSGRIMPGNFSLYEEKIKPAIEKETGRPPQHRDEIRKKMTSEPYYQLWSAMTRRSQEMMWDATVDTVERQLDGMIERFRSTNGDAGGSLTLNPDLEIPRYHSVHDIHIQPGGYHTDQVSDDITAGALYETGLQMYMAGGWGPEADFLGRMLCEGMRSIWPDFKPRKILDMGCGAGNSTLPWGRAFPDAELHAIDVGAPMLRYGHARAESLGVAVHFNQQNAERTDYGDGSFDLIVSHIMLHETSKKALPRIFAETRRLLSSGGRMLHFDIPRGDTIFDQFMHDWESYNNNESFARCMTDIDLVAEARKAAWPADEVGLQLMKPELNISQRNYSKEEMSFKVLAGTRA